MLVVVCFFKQKTAYEMRISDWSSDVCSSDLRTAVQAELNRLLGKDDRIDNLTVRIEDDAVAVDGVVLVDQYAARLNAALAGKVASQLDRDVRVSIVQL